MSQKKRPAMTFYPKEWIWDVELRQCSIAARGLWIDLCCIMHEGIPYGHLTIPDALVLRMVGLSGSEYAALLSELEAEKASGKRVAYRTDDGVLYSRRMVRDEEERLTRRENGGKGGNPRLVNHVVNPGRLSETEEKRIYIQKENTKKKEVEQWFASEFWPTYPRKIAKPAALKAALAKGETADDRAAIIAGLKGQLPKLREAGEYCPYPASWLNAERWKDEATASAPSLVSTMSAETRRLIEEKRAAEREGREPNYG